MGFLDIIDYDAHMHEFWAFVAMLVIGFGLSLARGSDLGGALIAGAFFGILGGLVVNLGKKKLKGE